MTFDDNEFAATLPGLLAAGDIAAARQRVKAFVADIAEYARPVDDDIAGQVLQTLRDHRLFDELVEAGDAICQHPAAAAVRRLLAHGLIEQGRMTLALDWLTALTDELHDCIGSETDSQTVIALRDELAETLGSCGRAYKQLYIDADPRPVEPRAHDLAQAIRYYADCYQVAPDEHLWHGVNYLALMVCARRRGGPAGDITTERIEATARALIAVIDERENEAKSQRDDAPALSPYDYATRAEARLALRDHRAAIADLRSYLSHPGINPFMLGGTLRQFEQIWQLTTQEPPGKQMLPVMRARLGELGGRIEIEANLAIDEEQSRKLEKVWGNVGYQSIEWLQTALTRTRAVARIGKGSVYTGAGTGFVFDGAWLGERWRGKQLLLTNAHVCTSDAAVRERVPYPMAPQDAMVAFFGVADAAGNPAHSRVLEELYTSPPHELDATLLLIDSVPSAIEPLRLAFAPVSKNDRVNIIGHPFGGGMTVSLQDNLVVAVHDTYLHYRTPTDPGSSGSPIFNQDWEIVGLHHASAADIDANEGIRIERLLEAMRAQLC